jgi:hypothetical protein
MVHRHHRHHRHHYEKELIMNIEITTATMLTVAGNGAFIWIVLQFLVRPWLKPRAKEDNYPAIMNSIAFGVGLIGAIAATAIMGFSYENIVNGVLIALGGMVVAVGGDEVIGNMASWYTARKGNSD